MIRAQARLEKIKKLASMGDLLLSCQLLLLPLVQDHVDQGQEDYRRKERCDYEYHAVYDVTP